jgi:hypothetical protein
MVELQCIFNELNFMQNHEKEAVATEKAAAIPHTALASNNPSCRAVRTQRNYKSLAWRLLASISMCFQGLVNRKQQPRKAVSAQTRRPKIRMHISPSLSSDTIVKDHCVLFVRFCSRASPAGQAGHLVSASLQLHNVRLHRRRRSARYINHN